MVLSNIFAWVCLWSVAQVVAIRILTKSNGVSSCHVINAVWRKCKKILFLLFLRHCNWNGILKITKECKKERVIKKRGSKSWEGGQTESETLQESSMGHRTWLMGNQTKVTVTAFVSIRLSNKAAFSISDYLSIYAVL